MKTNIILAGLMICSTGLFAQVEHDDMYFKKKDRINLTQQKEKADQARAEAIAKGEKKLRFDYPVNANTEVDDQLAHSINPEYLSQMVNGNDTNEDSEYFISNYRYNSNFDPNFINSNINMMYGSTWYYDMYFSPYYNPWRNPYQTAFMYDQFYNPYRNRWMNPYYSNGWNNVSLMSCYVSPWAWSTSLYYGNPYYGGYAYNPYPVIYINENQRSPVYGKRSSRSEDTELAQTTSNRNSRVYSSPRTSAVASSDGTNVRKTRSAPAEYYTPQWRRVAQQPSGNTGTYTNSKMSSTDSRSFSTNRSGSGSSTMQRSTYSAPTQRSSSPAPSAPARSSSSGSSSSPSRSSRGGN